MWMAARMVECRWCMAGLFREERAIRLSLRDQRSDAFWYSYEILMAPGADKLLDLLIIAQHVLNTA